LYYIILLLIKLFFSFNLLQGCWGERRLV